MSTYQVAIDLFRHHQEYGKTEYQEIYFFDNEKQHYTLEMLFKAKPDVFNLKLFTVVRNPFTRIVSYFKYFLFKNYINNDFLKTMHMLKLESKTELQETFKKFVEIFLNLDTLWYERQKQIEYLTINKNICKDVIILKLENIVNDIKNNLPLLLEAGPLPRITHRPKLEKYDLNRYSYKDFYNDYTEELIKNYYNDDFIAFNY